MNSITNIFCNPTKNILTSFSTIITNGCFNSLSNNLNRISNSSNISISQCKYSTLYPYKFNILNSQLKFYNTQKNQDSCNIQNACTSGIESNNDNSNKSSSKKFNNSETPFDIRHEGALTPMEKLLLNKLEANFEPTAIIKVKDISDGCGSLYMVDITSTKFDDLMMVKQHRIVMDILQDEMKTWHGIHIVTHPVHKRRRRRNNKKNEK